MGRVQPRQKVPCNRGCGIGDRDKHNVAAFTLCGANEPTWHKLGYFVKAYSKIAAIVIAEEPPYLYRLYKNLAWSAFSCQTTTKPDDPAEYQRFVETAAR